MKLEENRTLRAPRHVGGPPAGGAADFSSWVVRNLPTDDEKFIALAPGRLDVMGGISEYTGGLSLALPLAKHACAGAQRRTDGLLRISRHTSGSENGAPVCELPFASFRADSGEWATGRQGRRVLQSQDDVTACCAGIVIEALRCRAFRNLPDGLSVAVATDLNELHGAGLHAAVGGALLTALSGMEDAADLDSLAAEIIQRVENHWLGFPAGPADALCSLYGQAHALNLIRCDDKTVGSPTPLSCGVSLTAIDCGTTQPDHFERYAVVRTTAFMGRLLIGRIVRHEGWLAEQWDGHLSRISKNDFVERLRDRLPTKMSGSHFLECFGETGDALTRIDSAHTYKIRSRTEHHVYEHSRVHQFAEALARGMRNSDRSAFVEAGRIMNASHWSLGQRCGMGCAKSHALAGILRKAGPKAGVFGARIAGRGCGGLIAVLAEDSPAGRKTIEDSLSDYSRAYNLPARILSGSLPGAMVSGAIRV